MSDKSMPDPRGASTAEAGGESGGVGQSTGRDMTQTEGSRKKLVACFLGIFISYFIYGILQENITKSRYGPEQERFTFTLALVFVQCIINAAFARIAMKVTPPGPDTTPHKTYALMTLFYVGAMLFSNQALQYVSYPTQVLGKSAKPIPVMILGVLVGRKRYPLAKYLFVMMIVMGVALFIFKDGKSGSAEKAYGWGEILLLLSLIMDGLTGGIQERMRAEHHTQTHPMMLNANLWSIFYLGIGLVVTGEAVTFTQFAIRYPWVIVQMLTFSLSSAVGQNFIFMTVTNFGPLMCSICTTTRKFFTILTSVIIFGHTMLPRQWVGTSLVFMGLGLDSVYGKEHKAKERSKDKVKELR